MSESKFRSEIEIRIGIPEFRFRHRYFDELSMEFRRNLDFVERETIETETENEIPISTSKSKFRQKENRKTEISKK
jgi:hypothetical protein